MPDPLRIMIVEDEALLLMQLEAMLEDEGYNVVGTAMSSREAFTVARETNPDLALVDIHLLDGPTGVDVARHLKVSGDTLVVFITANAKRIPDDFVGAAGVISKPFSENGLRAALAYLSECIRKPPPDAPFPPEFAMAPAYQTYLATYAPVTGPLPSASD